MTTAKRKTPIYKVLYFQVICAIVIGILLGTFMPEIGAKMKPLGDGFIRLIKMIIAPVIFCTVVTGIAGMENMKTVGKTGGLALLYFEVVSTIALIIGLAIVNTIEPGVGMHVDPSTLDATAVAAYTGPGKMQSTTEFIMNIIPNTVVGAFAEGEILQVLFFSVLFGFALHKFGGRGTLIFDVIEKSSHVLFQMVGMIMRVAPVGAFGAMAFTIGKYGIASLIPLAKLMGTFYLTCLLFILVVLGAICRWHRFSVLRYLRLHQGRTPHRARDVFVRVRFAAHDDEDGTGGGVPFRRGPRDSDGLFLQPRRYGDLSHHGRRLHRAGL